MFLAGSLKVAVSIAMYFCLVSSSIVVVVHGEVLRGRPDDDKQDQFPKDQFPKDQFLRGLVTYTAPSCSASSDHTQNFLVNSGDLATNYQWSQCKSDQTAYDCTCQLGPNSRDVVVEAICFRTKCICEPECQSDNCFVDFFFFEGKCCTPDTPE